MRQWLLKTCENTATFCKQYETPVPSNKKNSNLPLSCSHVQKYQVKFKAYFTESTLFFLIQNSESCKNAYISKHIEMLGQSHIIKPFTFKWKYLHFHYKTIWNNYLVKNEFKPLKRIFFSSKLPKKIHCNNNKSFFSRRISFGNHLKLYRSLRFSPKLKRRFAINLSYFLKFW